MEQYIRLCPKCDKEIYYKFKYEMNRANRKNSYCLSCCKTGDKNPFYNKTHTNETKERIKKTSLISEKRKEFWQRQKTDEFRKNLSETLKIRQPGKGKGYYRAWIRKYGKEIADIKNKELQKRKSENSKGKRLGIPPKRGSSCGNGWSGWYKEYFFRSLGELSFIIKVIERFNFNGKTAENEKYKVTYIINGSIKTYFPDFVLNEKYVIECKPKILQKIDLNILKFEAARKKFKEDNLIFKIMDVGILDKNVIKKLYDNGKIKWTKTTEVKFKEYYKISLENL